MIKRKLQLRTETVLINPVSTSLATNSSQCGACSCEQHCEQATDNPTRPSAVETQCYVDAH